MFSAGSGMFLSSIIELIELVTILQTPNELSRGESVHTIPVYSKSVTLRELSPYVSPSLALNSVLGPS
jgi:hypothetical protein